MDLYIINDEYISQLQSIDPEVLENKNNSRPYVGIFIKRTINEIDVDFFVPLSSSEKSYNSKRSVSIKDEGSGEFISHLRFDKMIPVPSKYYTVYRIAEKIKYPETEDERKYARLLFTELVIIRKKQEEILKKFEKIWGFMMKKKKPYYLRYSTNIYKIFTEIYK